MANVQRLFFVISGSLGREPEHLFNFLEIAGVKVDREYGTVLLNIEKTRFALRGQASKEIVEKLLHDERLEILPDSDLGQSE
jgi:hypothetical protein